MKPQTRMLNKGYEPQLSEGAAVPPVFRTSTFVFKNCEEGKRAFEIAYGIKPAAPGEIPALIYSRVNNPDCEIVEQRIVEWDGAEEAALFSSGMGAISTTVLAFLRPGQTLVFSDPVYGGTEYFFRHILPQFGINTVSFPAGSSPEIVRSVVEKASNVRMIYVESPANPTMTLTDLSVVVEIAKGLSTETSEVLTMVDNTFLGPIFQRPLTFGVDLVAYSATKFIGGHSDLVAGITVGPKKLMTTIKAFRTILGSNSDPDTAWLIIRSLGTLTLRMEKQQENALKVVEFLAKHKAVTRIAYPSSMGDNSSEQMEIFDRMCLGSGSIISFEVRGGEAEAYKVLNAVHEIRLAVSLGGIETLIEHPYTMTHADMTAEEKLKAGIAPGMIRLSVGLEDPEDLIEELDKALSML